MTRDEKRALAAEACASAPAGSGQWGRVDCPFCILRTGKADHRQSFGFNHRTGWYHCFKCSVRGRLDGWEPDVEERPAAELDAVEAAAHRPPEGYTPLWEGDGLTALCAGDARRYLTKRGIPRSIWKAAQIGACLDGKYEGRIIVPVLAPDGSWLGWVGRAWTKALERAYTYPMGMKRREILYNSAALLVSTDEPAFAVEGVFDALALWPDGVALLGKPSEEQIFALAAASRPIAVTLDGDAWREGWALGMRLRLEGQRAGSVKLEPRVDPDEVEQGWLRAEGRACLVR
jgi:hypothetical protein